MTLSKRGPYISEGGDEVYLRRSEFTYNEARTEVARFSEDVIGEWGRSRYIGKRDVPLHDHGDGELCLCLVTPAWAFELYEGTWRA